MNQPKRTEQIKQKPQVTNRRPKRCMVCRKMFAFEKFNEHVEACTKLQQKKIEDNRLKQRNPRNSTNYKPIQMPTKKKQVQQKPARQSTQEGNRFRIKSMNNGVQMSQYKSKSLLVNNEKKKQIKIQQNRPIVQEIKKQKEQKVQNNAENTLMANESVESIHIHQQSFRQAPQNITTSRTILNSNTTSIVDRSQIAPISNLSQANPRRNYLQRQQEENNLQNYHRQPNRETLIESNRDQIPQRQENRGYDIQALINNSNSIIQFIRSINILGDDETMNTMLGQLQQLNLIAQQIVQLSSLGHAFGSTMGNVFAARIHELQTVITNQIGIALIRGFNQRLGAQFQGLMQQRPQIKQGFTQAEIEQIFPERVNFNRKECSICLDDMKPSESIIQLQCYHLFHPGCIKQWLLSSRKCPMCRKVQQQVN